MTVRRRVALLAALALVAFPALWVSVRGAGANETAYRAIIALERRDARALFDLGSARERRRAGMTPARVAHYLNRTLYREGNLRALRVVRMNVVRPNFVQFLVETNRVNSRGGRRRFLLSVQQLEGEPFTVALGELLWNVIEVSYASTDPAIAARVYASLRTETGIAGWYTATDGWRFPR